MWTTRANSNRSRCRAHLLCAMSACAALAQCLHASANEEEISIEPSEPWSTVFGDRELSFHFLVHSTQRFEANAVWSLAVDGRVLSRRSVAVQAGPAQPGEIAIRFRLPATKPGVILDAVLEVSLILGDSEHSVTKRLWVFPDDPFHDNRQWLKEINIALYDPIGATAEILAEADVPFEQVRDAELGADSGYGLLVVGEGISFFEFRNLDQHLFATAAAGVPVLCFAPVAGSFELPGLEDVDGAAPSRLAFEHSGRIKKFDKRLDARGWADDGKLVKSRLSTTAGRSGIVAEFSTETGGWPWVELDFPADGGRLVFCGFAICEKWDTAPTPRHLFAEIIKHLVLREEKLPGNEES